MAFRRAGAGAEFDAPSGEVLFEPGPFGVGRFAVFLAWPLSAAPGDECAVVPEHVILVDRGVALGRGEIAVTEDLCGDMDG